MNERGNREFVVMIRCTVHPLNRHRNINEKGDTLTMNGTTDDGIRRHVVRAAATCTPNLQESYRIADPARERNEGQYTSARGRRIVDQGRDNEYREQCNEAQVLA